MKLNALNIVNYTSAGYNGTSVSGTTWTTGTGNTTPVTAAPSRRPT